MIELGPEAFLVAFAAGLLSFTSPCVLPLVPGYLSLVSGIGFDELGARPRRVVATTGAFVVGFTGMFVALGAGAAWFGNALLENRRPLQIAAGIFIVVAGLVLAGLPLPRAFLSERRLDVRAARARPLGAALAGTAFAVGWTPCVGPTLAAILALAAAGNDPAGGAILLAVYSLGLGVPFLLFGLAFTRSLALVSAARRHWRLVAVTSGSALVVFGLLLASGELERITARLARFTGVSI